MQDWDDSCSLGGNSNVVLAKQPWKDLLEYRKRKKLLLDSIAENQSVTFPDMVESFYMDYAM